MSLRLEGSWTKSLSLRLTVLHAAVFGLLYGLLSLVIYFMVARAVFQNVDTEMLEEFHEMEAALEKGGLAGFRAHALAEVAEEGPENLLIRLYSKSGRLVFSSDTESWGDLSVPSPTGPWRGDRQVGSVSVTRRGNLKARFMIVRLQDYVLEQVVSLEWDLRLLARLRRVLITAALLTLLIAVPAGWALARRSLVQVKRIDQAARSIVTGSDLTRRVPVRGTGDELDELARTLNMMLRRIEGYLRELSDMMDNTAHDFKTPLARIRSLAEEALMETNPLEIQGNLVQIMEETDRFLSLINAVLDISEARAGLLRLQRTRVDLNDLAWQVAGLFEGACRAKNLDLSVDLVEDEAVVVEADRGRLIQALANLVDNAVKFCPAGGRIRLVVRIRDMKAVLGVEDSGPGVPPPMRTKIFERFFRAEVPGAADGRGVGLSLAKAYVDAHGGHIHVEESPLGGTAFLIHLPLTTGVSHRQSHAETK
ncbi:Signal transduction histidine kinase [Desulfacinum infernum DSM 9756]|uniref:histidine kinase n=1 Tax=Desulfacinum infernum DSM 9756 TaxID=1121391 RepID=A0A1M5I0F9_9BACT|nr:HAMP domain-containing sensor histidine kinase [Desulfacinum infernum]SHG21816.1 Signal transduction histidine kinase [Desulfacinum infernum DSM 9756]